MVTLRKKQPSLGIFGWGRNQLLRKAYSEVEASVKERTADLIKINEGLEKEIKEHIEAERALKQREERYRSLVESSDDSIYLVDKNFKYIFMNNKHMERMGLSEKEYQGRAYGEFHSPEDIKWFNEYVCGVLETGKSAQHEYKSLSDGRYFLQTFSPMKDEKGVTIAVTVISKNIDRLKKLEEELRTLSLTDDLTGLYNRRGFFMLADKLQKMARRQKKPLVMLYADLDGLKEINDTLGHKEGDRALIDIADILTATYRESDIISRIGGDEFAVIPIVTKSKDVEIITARMQKNIDIHNAKCHRNYKLSISWGITFFDPDNPLSMDDLLSSADKLMYEQKKLKNFSK